MDSWEEEEEEQIAPKVLEVKSNWDDEDVDEKNIKDSWEDDDDEPTLEKSPPKTVKKKKSKEEEAPKKATAKEEVLDPVSEKLRQQRLVEEADYQETAQLFGTNGHEENNLDDMFIPNPKSQTDLVPGPSDAMDDLDFM